MGGHGFGAVERCAKLPGCGTRNNQRAWLNLTLARRVLNTTPMDADDRGSRDQPRPGVCAFVGAPWSITWSKIARKYAELRHSSFRQATTRQEAAKRRDATRAAARGGCATTPRVEGGVHRKPPAGVFCKCFGQNLSVFGKCLGQNLSVWASVREKILSV